MVKLKSVFFVTSICLASNCLASNIFTSEKEKSKINPPKNPSIQQGSNSTHSVIGGYNTDYQSFPTLKESTSQQNISDSKALIKKVEDATRKKTPEPLIETVPTEVSSNTNLGTTAPYNENLYSVWTFAGKSNTQYLIDR